MTPISNIDEIQSLNPSFQLKNDFSDEINNILSQSFSELNSKNLLQLIFSMIDLTSLEGSDTDAKIEKMCSKILMLNKNYDLPNVAAICVYPTFAKLVNRKLENTSVNTACVAGAFPSGQSSLNIKLKEIEWSISQGATEIDMVISRGKLLEGKYQEVFDEITTIKELCGSIHLKVIIESGELLNAKNIRIASDLAMYAGANFIKTSTGKIAEGATYSSVYIMLNAVKDFYSKTGVKVGIKPAGGISDVETATNYLKLVEHVTSKDWLNKKLFRFGASQLATNVLNDFAEISKQPQLYNFFN